MKTIVVKCKKNSTHPLTGELSFIKGKSYRAKRVDDGMIGLINEQEVIHFLNQVSFSEKFEEDFLIVYRACEEEIMDEAIEKLNRRFKLHRVLDPLLMIKPDNIACVITEPDKKELLIFLSGMQVPIKIEGSGQEKSACRMADYVNKQIAPVLRVPVTDYKALLLFLKKISISALPDKEELEGEKWEKMGLE